MRDLLPGSLDVAHLSLDTQLTLRTDFTIDLGDFSGEHGKLVDHAVDGADKVEDLALYAYAGDPLSQITLRDGGCGYRDGSDL